MIPDGACGFRSKLDFSVDIEGAWSDQENKLLILPFNYYRITKTIGRFKSVQKEIWPDLTLLDDGFQCIFVPNHRYFITGVPPV